MLVFLFVIIDLYVVYILLREKWQNTQLCWSEFWKMFYRKFDSKYIDILHTFYHMIQIQPSYLFFFLLKQFFLQRGQVIYVIFVLLSFLCAWNICWDVHCCGRAIRDKGKTVYLVQNTCAAPLCPLLLALSVHIPQETPVIFNALAQSAIPLPTWLL